MNICEFVCLFSKTLVLRAESNWSRWELNWKPFAQWT